jgi:predicted DCC family thiol-disulfide oxidoreductase YuxK
MKDRWMVYYDGQCKLCSWSARWIIRNDPRQRFTLSPINESGNADLPADTVRLIMEGKLYERSTAVLQIAIRLRFPWPLLGIFFLVPRFLRDPLYNLVAHNRRRWFGESDPNCVI